MLLSHLIGFHSELANLSICQLFVLCKTLLVSKLFDLDHPVNKLAESSTTYEALDNFNTSSEFLLLNFHFSVGSFYCLSYLWFNFAQYARFDLAHLELVQQNSCFNQLSKPSAPHIRLDQSDSLLFLRLQSSALRNLSFVSLEGGLKRLVPFFFLNCL